jgi:hypothetical protein
MRFTTSHSSPWSNARGAHAPDSVLRVMQYAWSAPQFGSGNSWEATRVQVLAAALLSHADIICLQGLSHEQAQWMQDALDYKGFHGIISTALDSRSSHRAQGMQREALPDGPNAATFWRQKFTRGQFCCWGWCIAQSRIWRAPGSASGGAQRLDQSARHLDAIRRTRRQHGC